jgi:RNA polymerase sigma factor for flagellar operon FliA
LSKAQQYQMTTIGEEVRQFLPLVTKIAYHLKGRLPDFVPIEDLVQAGISGLLEALQRFDPEQGTRFETFAAMRIKGAMLDDLRQSDWTPRSVHLKARQIQEAILAIERQSQGAADIAAIADHLGISIEEYQQWLSEVHGRTVLALEALAEGEERQETFPIPDESLGPLERLERKDLIELLSTAIDALPEREKMILSLYYDDELSVREIGAVLGISPSRVSQLHAQAIVRLRSFFENRWANQ